MSLKETPHGETPAWIDGVLFKALQPDPFKRYESLSEFVHDLHHPNQSFLNKTRPALVERNPVRFWKSIAGVGVGGMGVVDGAVWGAVNLERRRDV